MRSSSYVCMLIGMQGKVHKHTIPIRLIIYNAESYIHYSHATSVNEVLLETCLQYYFSMALGEVSRLIE